jgi:hypothetical protein
VEMVQPHRQVNIVGAVPSTMRRNNLPLVMAITKVYQDDGSPVLLRVNEAAYKKDNALTLISEFQARENGCVINSVSVKHKTSHDNTYGTQSFQPVAGVTVPLYSRAALVGFKIHNPSHDDLTNLDIVDITSDKKWVPHHHTSEVDAIPPMVTEMSAKTEVNEASGASDTITGVGGISEEFHEDYVPLVSNLIDWYFTDVEMMVSNTEVHYTTVTGWLSTYVRDQFRGACMVGSQHYSQR